MNYINSEVGHLIEQHTQNEQSVVNPTRNLFPAIESAYDTDITGVSNPCYDESEDLSTLTDNHPELLEEIRTSGTEEQKTVVESFINAAVGGIGQKNAEGTKISSSMNKDYAAERAKKAHQAYLGKNDIIDKKLENNNGGTST